MTSRSLLAALLAATALAVPAAPALASSTQESIIEDEHQMLGLGPAEREAALNDAQALGADGLHVPRRGRQPDAQRGPGGVGESTRPSPRSRVPRTRSSNGSHADGG